MRFVAAAFVALAAIGPATAQPPYHGHDRHYGWHRHRHCRVYWHHHHRVRRCY